jgi:hypothetical protein
VFNNRNAVSNHICATLYVYIQNTSKFNSYLTENTILLHYKDETGSVVPGNYSSCGTYTFRAESLELMNVKVNTRQWCFKRITHRKPFLLKTWCKIKSSYAGQNISECKAPTWRSRDLNAVDQ